MSTLILVITNYSIINEQDFPLFKLW